MEQILRLLSYGLKQIYTSYGMTDKNGLDFHFMDVESIQANKNFK